MQIRWEIIAVIGFALVALIVFVIARNKKDKEKLEEQLKQDYEKPRHHEDDQDTKV